MVTIDVGSQVGSWVLQRLLGAGGMGRVYLAEHVVMGDLSAVKVLSPELSQRQDVVSRFINEARAAAKVRHRNLVRVHHIDQSGNGGPWYMVLEYLEGPTLAQRIAHGGPMPHDLIVQITCQIANALLALHQQGIVHRDIKPENILLVRRGHDDHVPIVLDLGVAHLGDLGGAVTQSGTVIGTPSYMAPEQLLGEKIGPAADIYALGVLVYEMSTGGWLPYQQDGESRDAYTRLTPTEIYRRQTSGPPVDPRRRNVGMSDAWAKALLALIEVDAGKRISNAKTATVRLGQAAPTNGLTRDGLAVIREYAPELLEVESMLETIRSPAPPVIAKTGTNAQYALGPKLGAGGMAEVFSGTQIGEQGFERQVAIKRVRAELSAQPGFAEMFVSEARIASRLSHPNIVSVLDFRRDEQDRLFLVMEYVEGRDLSALVDAGPLTPSTTIYITVEVLRGLGYAHDRADSVTGTRGVVHRDISPQNVLLSYEGEVKVTDFGLARARDAGGRAGSGTIRGKPHYMSPEQVRGEALDNRSDLFAVGVVLWETLACRSLFDGGVSEALAQVLFKDIPPPGAVRPDVPPDLEAVAMKLLARDVHARYTTAEEAIQDLLRCRDAPLNGRDELAAALAVRFPRPGIGRRGSADRAAAERVLRTEQPTAPALPSAVGSAAVASASTLSSAAGQATGRVAPSRVGRVVVVGMLAAASLALAIGAIALRKARTSPAAVTASDAAIVAVVSPHDAPTPQPIDAPSTDAATILVAQQDAPQLDAAPLVATAARDAAPIEVAPQHVPPQPRAPVAPPVVGHGELRIIAAPWATIWLDGKSVGTTPFRMQLTAGRHRVRLANDDLGKDENMTVTIEPDKTKTIERTW